MHDTMSCMETGAAGALRLTSRPRPEAGPGEVLIRVAAAGVNRADLVQRHGGYPPPPGASDLLGLEVSGHIAAPGPGVTQWQVGDAVCALLPGGGYAEYCVAAATSCLPAPRGVSLEDAAALPEAAFTAWTMLWQLGRLAPCESLLIHGGASGVGTLAIQMAAALGHPVYVTAGSPEKCALCLQLGAAAAIDYRREDFAVRIREMTCGRGVDVVLDMVGGDYVARDLNAMAVGGRLVLIAFQQDRMASIDIARMMMKRLSIVGATLRARSAEVKAEIAVALRERIWPLIEAGAIRPVVDSVYAMGQAEAAHERLASGAVSGKLLLRVG
ncbi:NAD(P)H-quinone oxidoreductase [Achromobacter xylosoxidans]|uniref:NAD(P)H-quinone oxidoreductase n=1 Tax=Alcaligenes xylosoxydans xylosoxydans TaxID=85698 RepID=UPI00211B4444|nr:NAD(P)H-quinone oxidoreductase [Achromobacter xylosoxidans]